MPPCSSAFRDIILTGSYPSLIPWPEGDFNNATLTGQRDQESQRGWTDAIPHIQLLYLRERSRLPHLLQRQPDCHGNDPDATLALSVTAISHLQALGEETLVIWAPLNLNQSYWTLTTHRPGPITSHLYVISNQGWLCFSRLVYTTNCWVHPKLKLFTHPRVIPILNYWLSLCFDEFTAQLWTIIKCGNWNW